MKKTTEQFIEDAKNVHGNRYDYSKSVYKGAFEKVCIICHEHGEFWQTPDNHVNGKQDCPICKGKKKLSTEEIIERFNKKHGGKYSYPGFIYKTNRQKIDIVCPKHGVFVQQVWSHYKCGCPKCAGKFMDTDLFIEKSKQIHGDKYDYSKTVYKGQRIPVVIVCQKHGEFLQTPVSHLNGSGCQKCGTEKMSNSLTKTVEKFIEESKKVHGNKYDYSKVVYVKAKTPVTIICPEHGEFKQTPYKHSHGQGCPLCKQSHLEREVAFLLKKNKIKFISQKTFKWLGKQRIDFYLPDYNIAIECQGIQHFIPQDFANRGEKWKNDAFNDNVKRDEKKKILCEINGVKIKYIVYDENIEEQFNKILSKTIQ